MWNDVPYIAHNISSAAQCEKVVSGFVPRVFIAGGLGLIAQVISRRVKIAAGR